MKRQSKGRQRREAKRGRYTVTDPSGQLPEAVLGMIAETLPLLKAARQAPRNSRFPLLMESLSDPLLERLALSFPSRGYEPDEDGGAAMLHLALGVRALLYGDDSGRFEGTDEELVEWVNKIAMLVAVERMRRADCFEFVKLPSDPFSDDADLAFGAPRPEFIAAMESKYGISFSELTQRPVN